MVSSDKTVKEKFLEEIELKVFESIKMIWCGQTWRSHLEDDDFIDVVDKLGITEEQGFDWMIKNDPTGWNRTMGGWCNLRMLSKCHASSMN